jgi:diaminohydroxyphosphoribosylaminopyrimidine deaminase/5-amino-6-(5-phosphoribosylamino)uracil reductase
MPITSADYPFMAQALRLAERGLYTTMPNPRVGCVLVKNGQVVGEGWHARAGEGHAEVNALAAAGENACGATAYVTLEPCSHTGKTGPCSHALVDAGVVRVVFAMEDPNPVVAGRGLDYLREAGIQVDGPLLEDDARALNPGFIKRMERKLPFVRCKMGMSLDGRTAMASGESQWVTGKKARGDVQRLRARSCAIISGINSVLMDNSSLTVRADELELPNAPEAAAHQPLRVVLDSTLRLSRNAKILVQETPILLIHNGSAENADKLNDWPAHVELLAMPANFATNASINVSTNIAANASANGGGRINLNALLTELAKRQCNEVLVEAGATLAASFLRRGLLDEVIIYMAPKLLGSSARPLFDLPLTTMSAALPLKISDMRAVGTDWRITATLDTEY